MVRLGISLTVCKVALFSLISACPSKFSSCSSAVFPSILQCQIKVSGPPEGFMSLMLSVLSQRGDQGPLRCITTQLHKKILSLPSMNQYCLGRKRAETDQFKCRICGNQVARQQVWVPPDFCSLRQSRDCVRDRTQMLAFTTMQGSDSRVQPMPCQPRVVPESCGSGQTQRPIHSFKELYFLKKLFF